MGRVVAFVAMPPVLAPKIVNREHRYQTFSEPDTLFLRKKQGVANATC
jgi:hypothetical protein